MPERYLLYIDILGFSSICNNSGIVKSLYKEIDSLNAHKHPNFTTIVFSDTILVYNTEIMEDDEARDYTVWYLIEFVEDLHHRLVGTDVYFRAILTHGEFDHYRQSNTECFYGAALVNAYNSEKQIQAIGLFIDDDCNRHNKYFRTADYSAGRRFIYLCRSLESLQETSNGVLPVDRIHIDDCSEFPYIIWDLSFLRAIRLSMRTNSDARVRAKHLATWDLYHQRYPALIDLFLASDFEPEVICPRADWTAYKSTFAKSPPKFRVDNG